MCLGRHPRTGSTAILFSGIQFFLYATLQAEAMVIHSCLKFEISYGLVSVVWPAFAQLQEWSPRSQIFRHWHPPIHSLKNKKILRFILSSYHKHTFKKIYNLNFPVHNTLAAIPPSEILTNPLLSPPKNIMFIVFLQFL